MSYVWKGLKQPDEPRPARMFCEPGRHDYRLAIEDQENARACRRCGARNWMPGYPKTTAAEVRARRDAGLLTLQTWSDELEHSCIQPLVKKLYDELFTLDRRVWARYDRCCHGGRNCLPPRPAFFDLQWSEPYTPAQKD